ncbi:MAG: efflux RND transporter periplasmic adaptor subunit [Acidobacteriaceae bacterium]|nr:efflux RND transporter periplasmic adaptor subunit [Acidobacteriaceae bacterium]
MTKYIVRTSLVWMALLAAVAGVAFYRSRKASSFPRGENPSAVQPVASGPADDTRPSTSPTPMADNQAPLVPVQLSPERMQSIGVRIGSVEYKQLTDDIRATGTVAIDERRIAYVQTRFPGYIRQVFANATYQYVRKGQPLFTIYSPELVATQQEYLLAQQNQRALAASTVSGVAAGAATLADAAEQRLAQWDVPASELSKLKQTGKPITDLAFNAPASGYITEFNALPNLYVEPSTRLYTLADLAEVWVVAQVFQDDVGRVRPGQSAQVTVDAYPGRCFSGRVEQVLPQVDLATRTVHVRLAISNPAIQLKPGMFVNVALKTNLGRQLAIPASAVMRSGTRTLVFLYSGDGRIEPKEIALGAPSGDSFVVTKGLVVGQKIVTSANFLIDSESQLQAAAGSFTPPPPGASGKETLTASQGKIDFTTSPDPPARGANTFLVRLADASGAPVTGADVTVTFYMAAMPAMGMAAMNTASKLTEKGAGFYEGSGALASGGTWQVTVTARKDGRTIATKQMSLNATGGM